MKTIGCRRSCAARALTIGFVIFGLVAGAAATMAAAQEREVKFTPPADVAFRTDTIISEGTRMAAEVFAPHMPAGEKLPTIIMAHGWGGTAAQLRGDAVRFAQAGYLAITFDYRGWGASDARVILTSPAPTEPKQGRFMAEVQAIREVVDPIDQTTDLANAVNWAYAEPQCDPNRIGLWGSSYSGGHVVYVAARDPRVKATVSQAPAFDSRWIVLDPASREQTFSEAAARTRGKLGYPPPGKKEVGNLRGAPIREKLMQYAPVEDVARASHCAMLFVLAEKEELFDNKDHGQKAFDRAAGPKKLVVVPGITHYGIYMKGRPQAQESAIAWFDEHLKK